MKSVVFLNGPLRGRRVELNDDPPRIEVADIIYERINDPDTGLSLGGYFAKGSL